MSSSWGIFSPRNYAGVDQGVDFRGAGAIPALDAATVTDVGRAHIVEGGTYPYVVYRLNAGPYRGSYVYTAENFSPAVHKGQRLRQGQSIGHAAGRYPYIEIGFNKSPTGWNAIAPLGGATAVGAAMKKYIYGLIGSAPPVTIASGSDGGGHGLFDNPFSAGNVLGGVGGAAHDVVSPVEAVGSFLGKLSDPRFWLRALEIVGGGLILMLGLYLLARQVGLGSEAPAPPGADEAEERAEELRRTFSEAPGIDTHRPEYRRSTEGVKRDVVKHDVSEAGERRAARRKRITEARPAPDDIPF